jgi:NADPH:quinone reductase-like Zn-dependent oxidoreductase
VDDPKKSIVRIPIPFTYKNPSDERAVDLAKLVAIILASTTAYQMIHRTGVCEIVKQCDNILVHSAAGAVGSALVSLLRLQFKDTVNIYGTASSHKSTSVKSLGATHIDYKTTKFDDYFQENNVHNRIVFDAVGSFIKDFKTMDKKQVGKLIMYGMTNGGNPFDIVRALAVNLNPFSKISSKFFGIDPAKESKPNEFNEDLPL